MRNIYALAILLAMLICGLAGAAEITLFKGDPIRDTGITLGGWGSGSAEESSERTYVGTRSIKIATNGLHEGGRIDFKNPIELLSGTFDDADYLQFILIFPSPLSKGSGGSLMPGAGSSMPTAASDYSEYDEYDTQLKPKATQVRIVIETPDSRGKEASQPMPDRDEEGWYKISVPFKSLNFKTGESFPISRILVFTDVPDTFYLGEILTVRDDSPIIVNELDDEVIAIYDTVAFRADAEGGASTLRYEWNFGDKSPDGVDATGGIVNHQYMKAGDFKVVLTVSDALGVKKPVKTQCTISVND
jgi:hypothetical protein